jgi:threonine dehydrogenase-like Zn-dependent dehydrogenase
MAEMTAAVLYGKEDLRLEHVEVPRAGAGEVVLRVGAALTCGTDLKIYKRGYHAAIGKPPMLFGHELAGTVVEVGTGVAGFAVGDRVVPLNSAPCDRCFFCVRGQQNLCEDLIFNNGAYAEFMREEQVGVARAFGASEIVRVDENDDVVGAARALTEGGRGADVVVEAVAIPETWEWAVDMVRKGGVVNFFGGPPAGTKVQLDTNRLHYGEITLKASFHHTPATARTAFGLVTSGRFKCAEYITARVGLDEVGEVFERMMVRGGGVRDIKTAVFPGGGEG